MTENKEYIKKVKAAAVELGEQLKADKWDEAFDRANQLNQLIKNQPDTLTNKEKTDAHFEEIASELKKYWYFNGEVRKSQGALRKKGDKFIDYAGK